MISRERPFLGSRRVNDSSTELGLPPHGNSLGLQNPSGYWESIAPAVPEISVPRKNLARSLPGFCPAFFSQALPGPGFTQCHTRAIAPGNNRWRSYNWDFPRASRGVLRADPSVRSQKRRTHARGACAKHPIFRRCGGSGFKQEGTCRASAPRSFVCCFDIGTGAHSAAR